MKNNTTTSIIAGATLTRGTVAKSLRMNPEGDALMAVGLPTEITSLPLRPLCAPGADMIIASLGPRLYSVHDGEVAMIADTGDGGEIYCGIAGGNRAIVMTSAGALHIVADGSEAVCLGTLPALPSVGVSLEVCANLSETVPPVAIADTDSLRSGALSARDAASLGAAFDAAWQRIKARARALGASVVPEGVTLIAEVRQLDERDKAIGSRGRFPVGGGVSTEAMQVSLSGDHIGPFVLTVPVVKARITVAEMAADERAVWGDGSVKAEVALSAAPAVEASWTVRVERPASGDPRVTVIPHLEAIPSQPGDPLQSVAVIPVGSATEILVAIPERVTDPVAEVTAGEGFIAHAGAVSGDVVVWGCLDGAQGDVAVASASSPLAIVARSTVSLSAVAELVAAPRLGSVALSPGCAHFYLFTADGILNLSVGAKRGAPAASLLDRRGVSARTRVAVMPECVVALTDRADELVMLRGGRASTLYHSASERFRAVAPGPVAGELYLLDMEGGIRAFDMTRGWLTTRSLPYNVEEMNEVGGRLFLTSTFGLADASDADGDQAVEILWRAPVTSGRPAAVRWLTVALDAPGGFEGTVRVWPDGFPASGGLRQADLIWQAAISGAPRSPIRFRLPLPVRNGAVIEIAGSAAPSSRIISVAITGCMS